jgi:hypothetical protein
VLAALIALGCRCGVLAHRAGLSINAALVLVAAVDLPVTAAVLSPRLREVPLSARRMRSSKSWVAEEFPATPVSTLGAFAAWPQRSDHG